MGSALCPVESPDNVIIFFFLVLIVIPLGCVVMRLGS